MTARRVAATRSHNELGLLVALHTVRISPVDAPTTCARRAPAPERYRRPRHALESCGPSSSIVDVAIRLEAPKPGQPEVRLEGRAAVTLSWKPYLHLGDARAASNKAWVRSSSRSVLGSLRAYSSVTTSPSVVVKQSDSSQPLLELQRAQMGWPPMAVRGNPGGGLPGNFGTTKSGSTLWSSRMKRTRASLRPRPAWARPMRRPATPSTRDTSRCDPRHAADAMNRPP